MALNDDISKIAGTIYPVNASVPSTPLASPPQMLSPYQRGQALTKPIGAARDAITTPIVDSMTAQRGRAEDANDYVRGMFGMDPRNTAPVPQPAPPSQAQQNAATAASKALQAQYGMNDRGAGYDASRPGPSTGQPGAKVSPDNVSDWNQFVTSQLSSLSGYPTGDVSAALAKPLPGAGKAAGEAAMQNPNLHTLNVGYGSTVLGHGGIPVRQADGTTKTVNNDFSGIGQGTMPAGAAGVFGPSGLPPGAPGAAGGAAASPFDQAQSGILQWMQEAREATARGDGIGARRASANAQRFAQLFGTMSEHPYQTAMAGVAQTNAQTTKDQLSLHAAQAQSDITMNAVDADNYKNGKLDNVRKGRAVRGGASPYQVQSVQPMTYAIDPANGQRSYVPMPPELMPKK